jgi:tRNA/tmRNA/rRNA uracil-C5-methylase (TrmA/RlmC/RlmD family)
LTEYLSIFAANTHGAEVLYSLIKDSMKLDNETVVLDICCGTGTIGITLANVINLDYLFCFVIVTVVFYHCIAYV